MANIAFENQSNLSSRGPVFEWFADLGYGWRMARERASARAELRAYTDRQLSDLGIGRADIERVVHGD